MEKNIWQKLLFFIVAVVLVTSCDDTYKSDMNFDYDVTIKSFSINGVQGVINEAKKTITVTIQPSDNIDVTAVSPQVELPDGATITPAITSNMIFPIQSRSRLSMGTYIQNMLLVFPKSLIMRSLANR
jgi:type III secretory pathway lipoprotein EscJ